MNKDKKIILIILVIISCTLFYLKIWQYSKTKIKLDNVTIGKIITYRTSMGDLHLPRVGYRIYIRGEERPIYFSMNSWDPAVKVDDRITLIVQRSYFGNRLDGYNIIKADSAQE